MARFPKPPEGSWTQHYPQLGTAPVSYEDSISPEFYEIERKAVFKRAWLNVGRVEQLPRKGSYFTKELKVANTSIIVVRNTAGRSPYGSGLARRLGFDHNQLRRGTDRVEAVLRRSPASRHRRCCGIGTIRASRAASWPPQAPSAR